jgi:hypothetical protein
LMLPTPGHDVLMLPTPGHDVLMLPTPGHDVLMLPTPGHDEYGDSNMHVCLCMTKLTMLTSDHKAGHN